MDSRVLAAAEKAQPGREVSIHESVARLSRVRRTLAIGVSVAAALSLSASGALSAFAQDVSQSNSNGATTTVGSAAGSLLGIADPLVIPITVGTGLNLNGPTNVNVASQQDESGNQSNNKVVQTNSNQANTHVTDASNSLVKGGAIVIPVTIGAGANVNGPTNVNVLSQQDHSGNQMNSEIWQSNENSSNTVVTDNGTSVVGLGPVVIPVTIGAGLNLNGPTNINVLSQQDESGNQTNAKVWQSNSNHSKTVVKDDSTSAVKIAGPVVVPATVGVGANVNGPTNVNVASQQDQSGNQWGGKVWQSNTNSSKTVVDDDSSSVIKVLGPVVAPVTVGVGANVNGPTNVNVLSQQDESGNQWAEMVWQSNSNSSKTIVDDDSQSFIKVLGPVVAPVTVGVGANVNGPTNVNVLSQQDHSGNAWNSSVWQSNSNSSKTVVDDDSHSFLTILGPVVAPVTIGIGANINGPTNVNVLSQQDESGNSSSNQVWQSNTNSSQTVVHDDSDVFLRLLGPVVAPVTVGVGININCPTNINVLSQQDESGNCSSPPAKMKMKSAPPPSVTPASTSTAMVAATQMTPGFPATGFLASGAGKTLAALGFLVLAAIGAAGALALRRFRPLS